VTAREVQRNGGAAGVAAAEETAAEQAEQIKRLRERMEGNAEQLNELLEVVSDLRGKEAETTQQTINRLTRESEAGRRALDKLSRR